MLIYNLLAIKIFAFRIHHIYKKIRKKWSGYLFSFACEDYPVIESCRFLCRLLVFSSLSQDSSPSLLLLSPGNWKE